MMQILSKWDWEEQAMSSTTPPTSLPLSSFLLPYAWVNKNRNGGKKFAKEERKRREESKGWGKGKVAYMKKKTAGDKENKKIAFTLKIPQLYK